MYSWHAYIIALGYKMIYVIMIIEGYSDGGGTLNFQSKPIHHSSCLRKSKSNAIQKPENQLFSKYVPRWSLAHQDQGHKYVDYVN